jgi:hypothetical protein
MELHTIGIDLGKTVFHLVGLNQRGEVVVRKKFSRKQLLHFTANLQVQIDWHGSLRRVTFSRLARMAWAVLAKNEEYRPPMLAGAATSLTGLQMTPGLGQAWKSHSRFPHLQTSYYEGVDDFCQVCWRTMRWHNGRTRRSQNL